MMNQRKSWYFEIKDWYLSIHSMTNAAAPEGAPPRRVHESDKIFLPAVPRRGPEAGNAHIYPNFHGKIVMFFPQMLFVDVV